MEVVSVVATVRRWITLQGFVFPVALMAAVGTFAPVLSPFGQPLDGIARGCRLLQVDASWVAELQQWMHSRSEVVAPVAVGLGAGLFMLSAYRYRTVPRAFENHTYLFWPCVCVAVECGGLAAGLWMAESLIAVLVTVGIDILIRPPRSRIAILGGLSLAMQGVLSVFALPLVWFADFLTDSPQAAAGPADGSRQSITEPTGAPIVRI